MKDARAFDVAAIRLPQLAVRVWQGLVFAGRRDPKRGRLRRRRRRHRRTPRPRPRAGGYGDHHRVDYDIACNWKVYVDNFPRGATVPFVHPGLNRLLDYHGYRTELARWHSLQWSPLESDPALYGSGDALYYWLCRTPCSTSCPAACRPTVIPLGVDRCRVLFDSYYADAATTGARRRHRLQRRGPARGPRHLRGRAARMASGSYVPGRLNRCAKPACTISTNCLRAAYRDATVPGLTHPPTRHRGNAHDNPLGVGDRAAPGAAGKPLGLWMAIALVVGSMIGSGVVLLPAALARGRQPDRLGHRAVAPFCWRRPSPSSPCIGRARAGPTPTCAARSGMRPVSGIAWSYWISIWSGMAAIAVAFAGSIGAIFHGLTATPVRAAACALLALWTCSVVNLIGLRQAGRLQVLVTALKLLPCCCSASSRCGSSMQGTTCRSTPAARPCRRSPGHRDPDHVGAVRAGVATVPAGAIRDPSAPSRAPPCSAPCWRASPPSSPAVVIGLVPPRSCGTQARRWRTPPAGSGARARRSGSRHWPRSPTFGAINGWMMVCGQVSLAAAGDGNLFPRRFARLDRAARPAFGILVGSMLATLLVIASYSRSLVGCSPSSC